MAIFTFGHSTHTAMKFLQLVEPHVTSILDVRSHPTSKWAQYHKESMGTWLPEHKIKYEWWPALGGWDVRHASFHQEMLKHDVDISCYLKGKFPKQRIAAKTLPETPSESGQEFLPTIRPFWSNQGLYDYSWFMSIPEFVEGMEKLIERGKNENLAIVCCEAVPWRCHRSMVSDYLAFRGIDSTHIINKLLLHSKMLGNRLDRYDPKIPQIWRSVIP